MASSSNTSSIQRTRGWTYEVFLSFRGDDTRFGFVDHLYTALSQNGIGAFKDDIELRLGESLTPAFERAIEDSKFAVVVFSENYANSSWCLEELTKIMECQDQMGLKVLPVFHYIEPSDVRKQKGVFEAAFRDYEVKFMGNMDKVNKWRECLVRAANSSGLTIAKTVDKSESAIISKIIQEIFGDINVSVIDKDLIGIESRINDLESKLVTEALEEVRIIGIHGMGGIGKTTIANALFRRISHKFQGSSFARDVAQNCSNTRDTCALQERIIRDILLTKHGVLIQDPEQGAQLIEARFRSKRVLLVLDNVNKRDQLNCLAAKHEWFGRGSRIIITTRDVRLLAGANDVYRPTELLEDQAIELFNRHAFRDNSNADSYKEFSKRAIRTYRLPLALKVIGSHFYGIKAVDERENLLIKIENTPDMSIHEILKLSYDGLESDDKDIFLDIACFFKGKDQERVTRVLTSFGFYPANGIRALIDKSLLTISHNRLEMHDLIQEMGCEVARLTLPNSRLWKLQEVHDFIKKNRKLDEIEAIVVLNKQNNDHQKLGLSADVLRSMKKLRLLDVYRKFTSYEPTSLPDVLRWLCWNQYPFSSLPLADNCELVGLEMHSGNIKHLWTGKKIMHDLKFIHLQQLECLKRFPDVSGTPKLERLILTSCRNLVEVHESLGSCKNLVYVDMSDCIRLKRFPSRIGIKSLDTLILSKCFSLEQFPEVESCMVKLSNIHLDGCSQISELPLSIRYLCSLRFLNLTGCTSLKSIPNSICGLKNLKSLSLHDCVELQRLPDEFGSMEKLEELQLGFTDSNLTLQRRPLYINMCTLTNLCSLRKLDLSRRQIKERAFPFRAFPSLEELNLSGNSELTELPTSIYHLSHLKHLELNECCRLKNLHSLPSGIHVLRASGCSSLEKIEDIPKKYEWLYKIWLVNCSKLEDETDPSKMLQLSFLKKCAAVCHRLSTAIPGSEIPTWFKAKQHGCDITLKLPLGWHSRIMGFAVSGVFSRIWNMRDDYPVIKFTIVNDGGVIPKSEAEFINDLSAFEVHTVWIGYIPFSSFQRVCHDWSGMEGSIAISIRLQAGQLPGSCGAQIIYKDELESVQQITSCISDYCNLVSVSRKGNSFFYEDVFWNT